MWMVNTVCDLEDKGLIDTRELATNQPVQLPDFGCLLRFGRVNPDDAPMTMAMQMGGEDVESIQMVWPDEHGQWPDSGEGWHYGDGSEQPVYIEGTA
jgi:hypothetical protein